MCFVYVSDLKKIAESDPVPMELEPYVKKLNGSRRRVMLVNSILQNVQVNSDLHSPTPDPPEICHLTVKKLTKSFFVFF